MVIPFLIALAAAAPQAAPKAGALTFSAPQKINDDPVNPSQWHWFGTFSVAPNGRLDAVWYDTRNAANNTDSQLFYSFSTDAGVTWSANVAVSNPFNPFEGYPNQNKIGDYITIVSDNTGGDVAYSATYNFNPSRGQHDLRERQRGDQRARGTQRRPGRGARESHGRRSSGMASESTCPLASRPRRIASDSTPPSFPPTPPTATRSSVPMATTS